MKAYISVSFNKRKLFDNEMRAIADTLKGFNISPFVFVDNHTFNPTQEQEMMQQAMAAMDNCDILLAETSEKGIGIGVEAGYAKAKGKPVIYLRRENAAHSTTVSGISDFQIIYKDVADLKIQLTRTIEKIAASG